MGLHHAQHWRPLLALSEGVPSPAWTLSLRKVIGRSPLSTRFCSPSVWDHVECLLSHCTQVMKLWEGFNLLILYGLPHNCLNALMLKNKTYLSKIITAIIFNFLREQVTIFSCWHNQLSPISLIQCTRSLALPCNCSVLLTMAFFKAKKSLFTAILVCHSGHSTECDKWHWILIPCLNVNKCNIQAFLSW